MLMEHGVEFVMTPGMIVMLELSAGDWDSWMNVSIVK